MPIQKYVHGTSTLSTITENYGRIAPGSEFVGTQIWDFKDDGADSYLKIGVENTQIGVDPAATYYKSEVRHKRGMTTLRTCTIKGVATFPMGTTVWAAGFAYTMGNLVRPVLENGHWYQVTVAGTSGMTEPNWPITTGGTITSGGVTFTEVGMTGKCEFLDFQNADILEVENDIVVPGAAPATSVTLRGNYVVTWE